MGGAAEGWRLVPRRGVWHVRFTHEKARHEYSTQLRDKRLAAGKAGQIYNDVISGRFRPKEVGSSAELVGLVADWLDVIPSELDKETVKTYRGYSVGWLTFFGSTLGSITKATAADYKRSRLLKVSASSVRKELSALRGFLDWCVEQETIEEAPVVVGVPKRATGNPVREKRPSFTPTVEQLETLFQALPPRCRGGHVGRGRFIIAYETGLRPATLDALSVPEHYTKGATHLRLVDEDDKNRYGRPLPLTPRARAVLDELAYQDGLLFGEHDYRGIWRKALKAAGLPATMVPYDLRHARIQHLVDEGKPLTGVAYLAGHLQLTTTNHYLKGSLRQAELAVTGVRTGVSALEIVGAKEGSRTPTPVRALEPERDGRSSSSEKTRVPEGQVGPSKAPIKGVTGVRPRSWVHEATANLLCLMGGVQ
jgi:site-specific recombinase XerD